MPIFSPDTAKTHAPSATLCLNAGRQVGFRGESGASGHRPDVPRAGQSVPAQIFLRAMSVLAGNSRVPVESGKPMTPSACSQAEFIIRETSREQTDQDLTLQQRRRNSGGAAARGCTGPSDLRCYRSDGGRSRRRGQYIDRMRQCRPCGRRQPKCRHRHPAYANLGEGNIASVRDRSRPEHRSPTTPLSSPIRQ